MKKYEYKELDIIKQTPEETLVELNKLGAEGFRLLIETVVSSGGDKILLERVIDVSQSTLSEAKNYWQKKFSDRLNKK